MLVIVLLVSCRKSYEELKFKPTVKVENKTCYVQDNTNHSHWCEITCVNNFYNIIQEAIRCQNETRTRSYS